MSDRMSRVRAALQRGMDGVVETVYPRRCAGCGLRGVWVCAACLAAQPLFAGAVCERCGLPKARRCRCEHMPADIDSLRSAGPYDGWLREAVHRMKYQGESARASHLGSLLTPFVDLDSGVQAIVPVPIHKNRRRERGFNQSELLAEQVSRESGVPIWNGLTRMRDTRHQVDLPDDERLENVRGAFAINNEAPNVATNVLLLDDVFTTGSTMGECAATLRLAGVERVAGISIC